MRNNLTFRWVKYILKFNKPAGTSRGVLYDKASYFIIVENNLGEIGIGECNIIPGLSPDDKPELEKHLEEICKKAETTEDISGLLPNGYPALKFAFETALTDLNQNGSRILYPSDFTNGKKFIEINGLVWMGDVDVMSRQLEDKVKNDFTCIKIKIGALNWQKELSFLKWIREKYSEKKLEIRVDANGAFTEKNVFSILDDLAKLKIHSIEQPIAAGNYDLMSKVCKNSPVDIALDEEIIGVKSRGFKEELLSIIKPQYIILKPSLIGGFSETSSWVSLCQQHKIKWWVTSALESNIGLSAIAQWTALQETTMPQGLGTGKIYTNNITSPLYLDGPKLGYNREINWDIPFLNLKKSVNQ